MPSVERSVVSVLIIMGSSDWPKMLALQQWAESPLTVSFAEWQWNRVIETLENEVFFSFVQSRFPVVAIFYCVCGGKYPHALQGNGRISYSRAIMKQAWQQI